MAMETPTLGRDPFVDEMRQIGNRWGHFVALGIALIILGTLAILSPFVATWSLTITFGVLLAVGGIVQIVTSFWAGQWRGFFVQLLLGILYLLAGGFMIRHPLAAAAGITLVLAFAYMAGGIMRIVFALTHRTFGTGWMLLNGGITLILGLMIWSQWPWDAFWVVGLFVGIDMVFLGWSWVMLGLAVRPTRTASPPV
jgi:uncharacterized membrane protein HdeD (DUF308 family)